MSEQREHIERVNAKIASHVRNFVTVSLHTKPQFSADELRQYVCQRVSNIAPDSPSRILRMQRAKRAINYRVVSRKDSLYEALPLEVPDDAA